MDYKKETIKIIDSAKLSLIELRKVAEQKINIDEVEPEKIKQAAASKRLAIEDSFVILNMIKEEEALLKEPNKDKVEQKSFFGVENKIK